MRSQMKARRRHPVLLAVFLISAVAFRAGPAAAPATLPTASEVSGTFTLTYVGPPVAKGMNANGRSVFISTAGGTNRNTGSGKYLSGARVLNVDTAAMVNGNGTHSGHATFTEGTSTVVKRFTGNTTTKVVKGQPESTFQGTWTIVRGTGRYAGITGNGTYKGRFESSTKYTVAWNGDTSG